MPLPGADRYDVPPVRYVVPAVIVPAHGHHRAVRLQAYGKKTPGADRYDVRPVRCVALAGTVIAHGHHRAVRLQAYGMRTPGADCLPVGDLLPEGETPLARVGIIAKLAIQDSRRTQIPRRFHGFRQSEAYRLRALRSVLVIARSLELRCRAVIVPRRKQRFRVGVVRRESALRGVLIVARSLELLRGLFIITVCVECLRFGVVDSWYPCRGVVVIAQRGESGKGGVVFAIGKQRFRVGVVGREGAFRGVLVVAHGLEGLRGLRVFAARIEGFRCLIVLGGDEDLRDVPRRDGGDGDEQHDDDGDDPFALALFGFLPLRALFFRHFQRLQFLCFLPALLCACGTVLVFLQALKLRGEASEIVSGLRLRLLPA